MNDPGDQRASDEAIKRTTNLTPVGVRNAIDATAIDFQRRVDSQASTTPTVSTPKAPQQIVVTETRLDGQPISLPEQNDNQNPFPKNSTGFDNPGTSATPYVMGTNRTTTDPTPADDSCALVNGVWIPTPSGGGPYDGVKFDFTGGYVRQVNNGAAFVGQADKAGGGVININMQPTLLFARDGVVFDSLGRLVAVGQEYQVGGVGQIFS